MRGRAGGGWGRAVPGGRGGEWSKHIHESKGEAAIEGGGGGRKGFRRGSGGVHRCSWEMQMSFSHTPPGKSTQGWWQQIALNLRQGTCNSRIRPGTTTHLSPAGDTVLDKGRILQAVATPHPACSPSGKAHVCRRLQTELKSKIAQGRAGQGRVFSVNENFWPIQP